VKRCRAPDPAGCRRVHRPHPATALPRRRHLLVPVVVAHPFHAKPVLISALGGQIEQPIKVCIITSTRRP
jgi:hypothetical protein